MAYKRPFSAMFSTLYQKAMKKDVTPEGDRLRSDLLDDLLANPVFRETYRWSDTASGKRLIRRISRRRF